MPTPSPGLKRVPRWRTMISPPVTVWPAKTFTPSRLALESRPLRDDPRPFLCAIRRLRGVCRRRVDLGRRRRLGLGRRGRGLGRRRCLARTPGRQLDLRDLDPRQLLPVAGAPLVAALGLELHDPELRSALVADDPRLHAHPAEL